MLSLLIVRPRVGASLLGALLVFLAGCSTTYPDDLESLRDDPTAELNLAGAEIADQSERDATFGSKPVLALLTTSYQVLAGADPAVVKASAVEEVAQHGWEIDDPHADIVSGVKRLRTGDARISIYLVEEDGEDRLLVLLEHTWNHPRGG